MSVYVLVAIVKKKLGAERSLSELGLFAQPITEWTRCERGLASEGSERPISGFPTLDS